MTQSGIPGHIAIIMDGNGRWASQRGLARIRGHERGAQVLREVTEFCVAQGVSEMTVFALSTENYRRRPATEVKALLDLLVRYLRAERATIAKHGIRLRAIGRLHELPPRVARHLAAVRDESARNRGMILRLALNYGGRQEILDAIQRLVAESRDGVQSGAPAAAPAASPAPESQIAEGDFGRYLYDPDMRDPDLLIRTAGEYRMSNFLLWQLSYSELYIADVAWPDFSVEHLRAAISAYQNRVRKFGCVQTPALAPGDGAD
ncbi:MAG: polyprenyl diphosphate synthase [Planctomycetes bacterium]|nr:polyprenyl diphosphate synthase [Planctomycetota bacterium]